MAQGEHNVWGKHTNFELGARVPLIFHAAGQSSGVRSNTLVESVDIYPTLAALAGLAPPPDIDGTDLSPLFNGAFAYGTHVGQKESPDSGNMESVS